MKGVVKEWSQGLSGEGWRLHIGKTAIEMYLVLYLWAERSSVFRGKKPDIPVSSQQEQEELSKQNTEVTIAPTYTMQTHNRKQI